MKKALSILSAIAAVAISVGCSVSEIEDSSDSRFVKKAFTFEASLSESSTKTGTTLNDDGTFSSIYWSPNDQINVFFTAGATVNSGCFTNKSETESITASFSGVLEVFTGTNEALVDEQMFWAIYPYSKDNTCNGSAISFTVPANQSSPAGTFAIGQWPTMARSNGFNLIFYGVCSGIKFKVLNEGVTSVTFANRNGNAINGTITAGWDDEDKPEITGIEGGSDQIVVTPQDSPTFEVGQIYFAVLPVLTMDQGIEVTYRTANSSCTYINDSSISFSRNTFNTLYDKDIEYEVEDTVFN